MLVPAQYVLQHLLPAGKRDAHTIFPYAQQASNVQLAKHFSRAVAIPGDVGTRDGQERKASPAARC